MIHVSSNITLLLRLLISTFWMVFFGLFTLAVILRPEAYFGNIPAFLFKIGVLLFYLGGLALLYFTLLKLKRVEMNDEHIYATNYFKHRRYPWSNVEKITERDFGLFSVYIIHLIAPGEFGRKLPFIASRKRLKFFLKSYPGCGKYFVGKAS